MGQMKCFLQFYNRSKMFKIIHFVVTKPRNSISRLLFYSKHKAIDTSRKFINDAIVGITEQNLSYSIEFASMEKKHHEIHLQIIYISTLRWICYCLILFWAVFYVWLNKHAFFIRILHKTEFRRNILLTFIVLHFSNQSKNWTHEL